MSGQHRIDKFIIHCQASENTGRKAVRAIASNREAIITIINSIVERYASVPETITIKSLNLHLGKLHVSDLPGKFNDRLARLLEAELKAFFDRNDVNAYLQEQGRNALDPFQQLHRYLHVGFDEHLLQDKSFDLERFVLKLFAEDSKRLAAVFTQAWSHDNARKRLLQLSMETREALREAFPLSGVVQDRAVIVPGEAFSLLAFYYDTGRFPDHATTLHVTDIETLLHQVLLTERQKIIQYFGSHISKADFLQRLADTLSLTLIKTIFLQLPGMDAPVSEWNMLEASANAVLHLELLHTPEVKKAFLLYATEKELQKKVTIWADLITEEFELQGPAFEKRTYLLKLEKQLMQAPFPHTRELISLLNVTADKSLSSGWDVAEEKLLERVEMYLTQGTLSGDDGSVSELLSKVWTTHSAQLRIMILDNWDDVLVRHRLIWQSSLDALNVTTHNLWKDHSSYGYWKTFVSGFQSDDQFWSAGGEKKLRELYERYYEYLSVYRGAAWNETLFKTWIKVVPSQFPQATVQSLSAERPLQKREMPRKRLLHRAEREHSDRAFEIVRLYLHTGNFPGDAEYLRLSDLEVLIDKLLTDNQPAFIQYLGSALKGESFMVRLAEASSLTTLKRIVISLSVFNDSLREWTVLEKWLAETFMTPPVVLMETKLLFLRYMQQPALNARVEIMREYMHIILVAQGSVVAWEKKLAQLKESPLQMATLHPTIVALIRKVTEEETTGSQWLQDLASQPDERVKTLSELLLDDTLQYTPSNLFEELQTSLAETPEQLLSFLKIHWRKITIRTRLVAHTTTSVLENITRQLWQDHSSYNAWRTFKETVDRLHLKRGEVTEEIVTRELYRLYFEFLELHVHDQWDSHRIDEWMLMNMQETMPRVFTWLEQEFAERESPKEKDLVPAEVSSAEAFVIVKDYYRQGRFPDAAAVWKEFHLDWLISRSMEQFESDVVEYVTEHLADRRFVTNVSETLSWALLERIVKGGPTLRQPFETWKVLKEVFEEAGLLRTLFSEQQKTFMLTFVNTPSPEAKARVLAEYIQQEIVKSGDGLLHVRRALLHRGQHDVLRNEEMMIMDQLETLIRAHDVEQEITVAGFISFLLKGSDKIFSPQNGAVYAGHLLQTDSSTLANQILAHWSSRPLRYRLASLEQPVLDGITKLVWGAHPSYSLWRTFIDWLPAQPDAETRKQLHFLYFDYLQQHGASWSERVFRDRMVIGLREYQHKFDSALEFWDRHILTEGTTPLITSLVSKRLSSFLSQPYGRSASKEEIQRFWDNMLVREATLFKVFTEAPVTEDVWTEIRETLTVSQLRHILYNLSTFQFSYLESLFQQLQHFAFPNLTLQEQDTLTRAWYLSLFKTFHQKGSDVEKEEAAQRSIQQVFQINTGKTLTDHLRYHQSKGTDIQQLFPGLSAVFNKQWPDVVKEYTIKKESQAATSRSEATEVSSAAADVAGGKHQPASIPATVIRKEYISKYNIADLIHFYLRSGEIPSWSSVKDIGELQKIAERYVQDASIEKLRELQSYLHNAETASYLKQLISPDSLLRMQRAELNEVGDRAIPASDVTEVSSAIGGAAQTEHPSGSTRTDGIQKEYISKYSIEDLIHFYLRSGKIPSWSSVKDLNELQKVAERYIQDASVEKIRELLSYQHNTETAQNLKKLFSHADVTKMRRTVMGAVGESHVSETYSTNVVIERQRIELLIYLWLFHELPWWFTSCDLVVKDGEASPDERDLKEMVLQNHLEAFIQVLRRQPEEGEMVKKLMIDMSLPFFYKIITARFPAVSGFIVTTFTLLNESLARKEVILSIEAGDLYTFVYRFILAHEHDFSSRQFIRYLLYYIWKEEQERKQFSDMLFKRAENLRQTKDNRFWIVSELLNDPEINKPAPDDSSLEDVLTARRIAHIEKSDEDWLREAVVSYIRFGTIPLRSQEKTAFTKEVFLKILRQQALQESASLQLIVKSLLSNLSLLNAFVQRADQEIVDGILELLSARRYQEFISWKNQWVNFVAWALQEAVTTLDKIATKTLFTLLQQKADFAISQISYILLSFETLFRETKTLSLEELTEKVRIYKEVESISVTFIDILQDAISYLQENERFKLMKSLLAPRPELSLADITDQLTGRLLVQNAGIVIIGPFLYRYFSRLQMLEDNKFKSEELALRAVHLLQFMATGKTETPEHAMILNKILCGVKITTPIESHIELTQEEKEVSESLLQGVLQNWDKLKTKSIDALREGFLMRDGYLEETEVGWMLEVDRKAMDILVDLIPWSFSMIKLGWMEKSLATTWQSSEYRDLMK